MIREGYFERGWWCDIIVLCKYELPCVCGILSRVVCVCGIILVCGMCGCVASFLCVVFLCVACVVFVVCACVWHHSRQKARRGCCRATDHFLNAFRVYFGSCTHKCKGACASQCCTHKCPLQPQVQGCSRGELS